MFTTVNNNALECVMQTGGELFEIPVFSGENFWRIPKPLIDDKYSSYKILELEDKLIEAIERANKVVGSNTVGITLSGGVDSSLLSDLVSKYDDMDVIAYHSDWGESCERREIDAARTICEHLGIELQVVDVSPEKQIPYIQALAKVPVISYTTIAVYMTFNKMKQDGIKYAYSALGLDELMAGYTIHKRFFERKLGIVPYRKTTNKYYRYAMRRFGTQRSFIALNSFLEPANNIIDISWYPYDNAFYSRIKERDLWQTIQKWTLLSMEGHFIPIAKRCAEANGVTLLFPYIDKELMRYCLNLKPKEKYNKAPIRRIMRLRGIPESIVVRGEKWDKIGWGGTIKPYLECEAFMREIVVDDLNDKAKRWFSEYAFKKHWVRHMNGNPNRMTLQFLIFLKILDLLGEKYNV